MRDPKDWTKNNNYMENIQVKNLDCTKSSNMRI